MIPYLYTFVSVNDNDSFNWNFKPFLIPECHEVSQFSAILIMYLTKTI